MVSLRDIAIKYYFKHLLTTLCALVLGESFACAQIVPDQTLPSNSRVTTQDNINIIEGGTQAGSNLFHSFDQFSVLTGSEGVFNNAANVQNIISRITGKSVSNIDGTIRALGNANLFLINPNGIVFGENAKLDIGGSFVGSTASGLRFADGFVFSTHSQASPLLTISAPIGLQLGQKTTSIVSRTQGLEVKAGKSLFLLGGDIILDGAAITALDGQIQLGGYTEAGTIDLAVDGNKLGLSFVDGVALADVSLLNGAKVNVTSQGNGSIGVNARNLGVTGGSQINAGILNNLTATTSTPGNINVKATGTVNLNNGQINNTASLNSKGNAGAVNINAGALRIIEGARISTRTLGEGNAGNINIKAGDVYINNPAYISPGNQTTLEDKPALDASNYKNNPIYGKGRSGDISVLANGNINLIGNGQDPENKVISTYNRAGGKGDGNISLVANGSLDLTNAYIASATFSNKTSGGNIFLQGDKSISIVGNRINTTSFTSGDSGDITLNSQGTIRIKDAIIRTDTNTRQSNDTAGDININAGRLEIDGGRLRTRSLGQGNAGNININAADIYISNPAYKVPGRNPQLEDQPALDASNYRNDSENPRGYGLGSSGNIKLTATGNITLIGKGQDQENKVISTYNRRGGKGGGGISLIANGAVLFDNAYIVSSSFDDTKGADNIIIQGNESITLKNNSAINAISFNTGNSGNVTLLSQGRVVFQTSRINTQIGGEAFANRSTLGNAGNITISGGSVSIIDGSELKSSSFAGVNSGKIQITAPEFVELYGFGLFPPPAGYRPNNFVYNSVTASSEQNSIGTGGDIFISTQALRLADGAHIRANTRSGQNGGNINIDANSMQLTGGGQIITTSSGKGNAGNITLNVKDNITITGINPQYEPILQQAIRIIANDDKSKTPEQVRREAIEVKLGTISEKSGVYADTTKFSTGNGGNLNINTSTLTIQDGAQISVNGAGTGTAGNLTANASTIRLNQGRLTAETQAGEGANINLQNVNLLTLQNQSLISAQAFNAANGGNITINAKNGFVVGFPNQNNDIVAGAVQGRGGKIDIVSASLIGFFERPSNPINTTNDIDASSEFGTSGSVIIDTKLDPSRGLLELPVNLVDSSQQISQACTPGSRQLQSSFVRLGRGGISINPLNPLETLEINGTRSGWITIEEKPNLTRVETRVTQNVHHVIEAQGWIKDTNGDILLVDKAPNINQNVETRFNHISTQC